MARQQHTQIEAKNKKFKKDQKLREKMAKKIVEKEKKINNKKFQKRAT